MRNYYSGEILFCGVLRRYASHNIVAITGSPRLNGFTLLYVFTVKPGQAHPQDSINEFIIRMLNPLVVVDFRFISAFLHA